MRPLTSNLAAACARWLVRVGGASLGAGALSSTVRTATADAYFLQTFLEATLSRLLGRRGAVVRGGRRSIANVGKTRGGVSGGCNGAGGSGGAGGQDSLVARMSRRFGHRDTQAATLSRQSVQRVLALRQCVPLLGLAGVCLVDKPTFITPDQELEGVCLEIRKIFDKINFDISNQELLSLPTDEPVTLANFELGDPIAKGCNAVVYSARYLTEPKAIPVRATIREEEEEDGVVSDPPSPPLSSSPPRKYAPEIEAPAGSIDGPIESVPSGSLGSFDLALKMMFNYDAESNAAAIWNSLSRECAPAVGLQGDLQNFADSLSSRDARLPPHPCVVDVKVAFVDRVPLLRGATQLYPVALPPRLNPHGIGRNATMFLVMKRYHCSLRDYLRSGAIDKCNRPDKVRLTLCAQLFEAVAHMVEHGVAHRDIKSDNVLVDLSATNEPRLALTDFGCCLIPDDCITPLRLPFSSAQVSRGGNVALMAPEVQTATPGLLSSIDYSRADLWSVATLAFEIYGEPNPFYEGTLRARDYSVAPELSKDGRAPVEVRTLVAACLQRDPSKRPSPVLAAVISQLLLHAPPRITKNSSTTVSVREIVEWLCDLAVDSLFAARREEDSPRGRTLDQALRRMFLGRAQLRTILEALSFIREARQPEEDEEDEASGNDETDQGTSTAATEDPLDKQAHRSSSQQESACKSPQQVEAAAKEND